MNNIFDISRFGLLVKKDFAESWMKYLMVFLAMFGIISIVFVWISWNHYEYAVGADGSHNESLLIFGMILFLVFGCVSASWLMDPIKSKTDKMAYLMNPASSFEKYLMRWLFMVVFFIVLYIAACFMADFMQWLICSIRYPFHNVEGIDWKYLININDENRSAIFYDRQQLSAFITLYFFIQSLFVLGSTFWQKSAFVKTFCAGLVIFILYLLVCGGFISALFEDGMNDFASSGFESVGKTSSGEPKIFWVIIAVGSFFTVLNWVLGYFRFRETEIAKRI